ncbi:aromatic acid exporter family protein [Oceanobacillus damuensis]|uniref:aromatic acid exporter family protein n=1 Tax=Oceanobacillus damuensis TaxID=937928 RepID=UPI0008314588|nr:aromatic acid exporter family protein [Oceanobacillus damuensis]
MKIYQFIGSRVVKTGVAVFLTALICQWIGWPPVFAVITAIVTIEPTVSDSIKKGIVRFPASAIGSAYAVLFISLFGNSPLTYTMAAVFTIATCYRLKLHAGLLVATLTSVAMIEVIHGNFMIAFFTRLGTTTIGLGVSTIVNMFILPPDYRKLIQKNVTDIKDQTALQIERIFKAVLTDKLEKTSSMLEDLRKLDKDIKQTEMLSSFQKDEDKYHPLIETEQEKFQHLQNKLSHLRLIHYHLSNLIHNPLIDLAWTESERNTILLSVRGLVDSLQDETLFEPDAHSIQLKEITEIFWEDNEEITKNSEIHPTNFPPELIILYELVSIYDLVAKFYGEKERGAN